MTPNDNLPPLPFCTCAQNVTLPGRPLSYERLYTADQMREYAREAIAESESESIPAAWKAGRARAYEEIGLLTLSWRKMASAPINTPILVASPLSAPCVAELRASGACDDRDGRGLVPTHWMPIPPLPEVK